MFNKKCLNSQLYSLIFQNVLIFFLLMLVSCTRCEQAPQRIPAYPVQARAATKIHRTKLQPGKAEKINAPLIMLDAGHGGEDFGTNSSTTPKYQEKSLNLSTTLLVRDYLQQFGYKVILTRKNDLFIPLDKRAALANEANPRLFVSIHYNSAPSKDAQGVEVYYYNSDVDKTRSHQSKTLAKNVLDNVLQITQAKSRGVKHGNFAVIRETKMPAILIEGGFMTNGKEMDKIKDPQYIKQIAWGITLGINEYLKKG